VPGIETLEDRLAPAVLAVAPLDPGTPDHLLSPALQAPNFGEPGAQLPPNAPVLTAAYGVTVQGSLSGPPKTSFRIDFFANAPSLPLGQGEMSLGSITVATDDPG